MKRSVIMAGLSLLLIASCKKKKAELISPIISPVTEAVFAPGHIEANDQFTLSAMADGYLEDVLIREGDLTVSNQLLFVLDNSTADIQQQTATANLAIAEKQAGNNSSVLQQLQTQLTSAKEKLANDEAHFGRMQRLYQTNSVARVELDNAKLSLDNSVNNVASIEQNIAATKMDLQQALVNSRGQQQSASVNNNYYRIRSSGDYKVYSVLKKKGDLVRKGEAIAILGSAVELKVVMSIDEASIAKVKLHQKVLIELNTLKGKSYEGRVSQISPSFDAASQSYTVEATLDTVDPAIPNGTLLQANIIVAFREKALLIPRDYMTEDGKVLIKKRDQTDTVLIRTGIISTDWVEVLGGLGIRDKIVKPQ